MDWWVWKSQVVKQMNYVLTSIDQLLVDYYMHGQRIGQLTLPNYTLSILLHVGDMLVPCGRNGIHKAQTSHANISQCGNKNISFFTWHIFVLLRNFANLTRYNEHNLNSNISITNLFCQLHFILFLSFIIITLSPGHLFVVFLWDSFHWHSFCSLLPLRHKLLCSPCLLYTSPSPRDA